MSAKHFRHIALTESLAAWIDSQVAKGEYASSSDLIRTAIRVLRSRGEGEAIGQTVRCAPASLSQRQG